MAEVGSRKDPFGRSARQLLMATYTGTNFHLLVNSTVYQKEEENTIHVIIKIRHLRIDWPPENDHVDLFGLIVRQQWPCLPRTVGQVCVVPREGVLLI